MTEHSDHDIEVEGLYPPPASHALRCRAQGLCDGLCGKCLYKYCPFQFVVFDNENYGVISVG